jgi:hypothetical protein
MAAHAACCGTLRTCGYDPLGPREPGVRHLCELIGDTDSANSKFSPTMTKGAEAPFTLLRRAGPLWQRSRKTRQLSGVIVLHVELRPGRRPRIDMSTLSVLGGRTGPPRPRNECASSALCKQPVAHNARRPGTGSTTAEPDSVLASLRTTPRLISSMRLHIRDRDSPAAGRPASPWDNLKRSGCSGQTPV